MKENKKYQELYLTLRKQILQGEFLPNTLLPSESELREMYKVTQPTIRHALNLLVEERLIKKHHGKGSIVQVRPLGIGIISLEGRSVTSQNDDAAIKTVVHSGPSICPWPNDLVFTISEDELKNDVVIIERIRSVNGKAVFFEKIIIPNYQLKGFCSLDLNNLSLYDMLGIKYQIAIKSSEQQIKAVNATDSIAKLLTVKKGKPIVRLDRRLETNRSGFNIYSTLFANTDNYVLYSKS